MAEMKAVKLLPFHEAVQADLRPIVFLGINANERKQGGVMALLALISKAEIPAKAIPDVKETCANAKEMLEMAAAHATGLDTTALRELIKLAGDVVANLELRLQQKAEAATKS